MSVKRSRSASRVLSVLEGIAQNQPIGVSELSRILDDDKSAVQRAIMTLADEGWIAPTPGTQRRWQLTAHILTVATAAHRSDNLRVRAKLVMENLRSETKETVLLAVPDHRRFVIIEVLESQQLLRMVPHVGMTIPAWGSATSRAILAYLPEEKQLEILGEPVDEEMAADYATIRTRGFAISAGDVVHGSTNIAAPIIESDGWPVAALVVSAPSDRLSPEQHTQIGEQVLLAAQSLSRGFPRLEQLNNPAANN